MACLTTTRKVKNKNWLRRNWKLIHSFEVMEASDEENFEAFLTAYLNNVYSSRDEFTDAFKTRKKLWKFLNKPIFHGIRIEWFQHTVTSGKQINMPVYR